MNIKKKIISVLAIAIVSMAIANPPAGAGPAGGQDPDNDVPIDGGISLLVAAGVGFGLTQIFKKKKKA